MSAGLLEESGRNDRCELAFALILPRRIEDRSGLPVERVDGKRGLDNLG